MRTLSAMLAKLAHPANDDFEPSAGDAIARHMARQTLRRGLATAASCCAALIIVFTLVQGAHRDRDEPAPTFANLQL